MKGDDITMSEAQEFYGKRKMFVIAECTREQLDAEGIDFLDICEGFQGEDIVIFTCPLCHLPHRSTVFSR